MGLERNGWRFLAVLCLGVAFSCASAWADRIYVERASGSGVSNSDLETATELIQGAVPQVSSDQVVSEMSEANLFLRPHLLRLGSAYLLQLEKADREGEVIFSGSLKAERMDELDIVARRLTRAVLSNTTPSSDERVGEITNEEAHNGTQRNPTRSEWYLGFGGSDFSNMNVNGLGYSLGAAHVWDINVALIKIIGEFSGLDSAFMTSLGLGGDYFFSSSPISPYVGGDFGFGAAKAEGNAGFFSGDVIGGFDLGGEAGIEFFRTSAVNLDLGFRAGVLLHSNSYGSPAVYSLRLGVLF